MMKFSWSKFANTLYFYLVLPLLQLSIGYVFGPSLTENNQVLDLPVSYECDQTFVCVKWPNNV